jgi:hypothetical protein
MAAELDLPTLASRAAIADVVGRYCHNIDRRLWQEMAQCFHSDATYRFGHIEGGWEDFVRAARAVIDPLRISHHQLGTMLIRVDGDVASSETYFTAYHRVPADAPIDAPFAGTGEEYDVILAGRYIDRFERRRGDWRIAHRIGVTDWRRDAPAADAGLFEQPPAWRGSVHADDPGALAMGR